MASFVLIHGSWHGGWCFDAIRPLLEAQGHEVLTPDLPGMGGDAETLANVTLQGWADFTVEQCRAATQKPVILCGHSRGGLVISQTAETDPNAMDALVYICAQLVPNGMSREDVKKMNDPSPEFDAIVLPLPHGHGTYVDLEKAGSIFAQLSPPDLVKAALERLVYEPNAPRATRLHLSEERFGTLPRHYIECTQDRAIPVSNQRRMRSLTPCRTVTTLETDHSPFLSQPHALANALLTIVAGETA